MHGSFVANKKGALLITAYIAMFALSILAVAAIQRATTEYSFAERYRITTEAYYIAEAGTEEVAYNLARKAASYTPEPSGATDRWDDLTVSKNDYLSSGFDLSATCDSVDTDEMLIDPEGIVSIVRHYNIAATATDTDRGISATVNQVVARIKTFTFQHAVFYADDLEVLPGANMILSGKVHSNKDIYVGCHATLTIDAEYLRSAGSIYNMRKDDGSALGGSVKIQIKDTTSYAKMKESWDANPLDSRRDDWTGESQVRWAGSVESSVHGVTVSAAPEIESIQTPNGYYAVNAEVKAMNGDIYQDGALLVEGVDIPAGTVTTDSDLYDQRENKYVKMTNIDLEKLAGLEQQVDGMGNPVFDGEGNPVMVQNYPNRLPANGLLYAVRDDAAGSEVPGIRLVNGAEIHNAVGLTVASMDPVYVQGDYNVTNKKPAAVICDAFNILSNNWDDANSTLGKGNRIATQTTVNSAILAGIYPTVGSSYSGGLENFPRLHEQWGSSVTLFIRGSFVMLWESQIAQGNWDSASYDAPVRNWDYDLDFSDSTKLPVFTPYAVEVERVAWWKE